MNSSKFVASKRASNRNTLDGSLKCPVEVIELGGPLCPFRVICVEFVMFVNVRFQGDFGHSDIGWWLYAAIQGFAR
jgi:hypothetical protein